MEITKDNRRYAYLMFAIAFVLVMAVVALLFTSTDDDICDATFPFAFISLFFILSGVSMYWPTRIRVDESRISITDGGGRTKEYVFWELNRVDVVRGKRGDVMTLRMKDGRFSIIGGGGMKAGDFDRLVDAIKEAASEYEFPIGIEDRRKNDGYAMPPLTDSSENPPYRIR